MPAKQPINSDANPYSLDVYILFALVALFGYLSFVLISPFMSVLLWAGILAIALNPFFLKLSSVLNGRKKCASILICLLSLGLLLTPTLWLGKSALNSTGELVQGIENGTLSIPAPNENVKEWPVVGERIFKAQTAAHTNLRAFAADNAEQIKTTGKKVINASTYMMMSVGQFILSIIFASVFLIYSGALSNTFKILAQRVSPSHGKNFVQIVASTTQNISKAVVGIAFLQAVLGAVGFFAIGLPFAGLWSAILFAAALVSLPIIIIVPAIIYVWGAASTTAAIIFTAFILPVMLIDNVLRPIIAAKGLATPMIVIFIGVIGGAVSFGLVGLFIGPVILAVFYEMVRLWTNSVKVSKA